MTCGAAIMQCIFHKYSLLRGRASRGEFLAYFCFYFVFCILWTLMVLDTISFFDGINLIDFVLMYVPFFLLPPLFSVTVRRFHDCGKSGWLFLLLLVPLADLFGLYLLCRRGDHGPNRFGPVPPRVRF